MTTSPEKYLYEWSFSRSSLLIRFYLFMYTDMALVVRVSPAADHITFCKLFWGVVCAPLVAFVFLLIGLVYVLSRPFAFLGRRWRHRETPSPKGEQPPKPPHDWTRAKRVAGYIPHAVAWFFDFVALFFQRHRWVGRVLRNLILTGAAVGVVGGLGYGAVRLVALIYGNWTTVALLYAVAALVGAVVTLGLSYLLGVILVKTGAGRWLGDVLWRGLCKIGRGFRTSGRFAATGYYATKYRTCPRVTLRT